MEFEVVGGQNSEFVQALSGSGTQGYFSKGKAAVEVFQNFRLDDFMRVENLSCSFGSGTKRKVVIDNVTVQIPKNTLTAIAGKNGSGKSTLLNALLGLMPADSGAIYLGNKKVTKFFLGQRLALGVVHQTLSLDAKLSVYENLFLAGKLYGLSRSSFSQATEEIFAKFQLEGLSQKKVAELSGGQKRKVDLTRALLSDPEVLFLDEASAALDSGSVKCFLQLLRERMESPSHRLHTVVTVTHRNDELEHCDRLILLESGKLKAQMSLADAQKIERFDKIVVGFRVLPSDLLLKEIAKLAKGLVIKVPHSEALFEFNAVNGNILIPEIFRIAGTDEILSVELKPETILDRVYRFIDRGLANEH